MSRIGLVDLDAPTPVVAYVHGGAFRVGDKANEIVDKLVFAGGAQFLAIATIAGALTIVGVPKLGSSLDVVVHNAGFTLGGMVFEHESLDVCVRVGMRLEPVAARDAREQLTRAVEAVFQSWQNPRAQVYRRTYSIPDEASVFDRRRSST